MIKKIVFGIIFTGLLLATYTWRTSIKAWSAEKLFVSKGIWPQGTHQSQAMLDYAIWLNPKVGKYYMEKSVPFNKRGEYAQGMLYLDKAVTLQPAQFLGYRGYVKLYTLHDYEGSLEDLKRLDALTPGFVDYPWSENIYFLFGTNHLLLKDWEQSVSYFAMAIQEERKSHGEAFVNPHNYLYRAIALSEQGKYSLSLQSLDSMKLNGVRSSELYYFKAQAHMKQGQREIAKQMLQRSDSLYKKGFRHWNSYYKYPYEVDSFAIDALYAELSRTF